MRVLSLFTGIGGLDLGIKIAAPAARTVCCVERDAYCRRVLAARMADGSLDACPIWGDITTFDGRPWRGCVDLIAGGFPCQDLSLAGRRAGIQRGNRSGLWYEFARIIGEVGPRYVFVENVAALVNGGLDLVLGSLADLGYDAVWGVVSAADVGAPHLRKRLFLLAHARRGGDHAQQPEPLSGRVGAPGVSRAGGDLADAESLGRELRPAAGGRPGRPAGGGGPVGEPTGPRLEERQRQSGDGGEELAAPLGAGLFPPGPGDPAGWREFLAACPQAEPAVCRDAARAPHRVDRLRALGNSVVPLQAAAAFTLLARRLADS